MGSDNIGRVHVRCKDRLRSTSGKRAVYDAQDRLATHTYLHHPTLKATCEKLVPTHCSPRLTGHIILNVISTADDLLWMSYPLEASLNQSVSLCL